MTFAPAPVLACGVLAMSLTKRTPVGTELKVTGLSRCRSEGPNVPLATGVKVEPSAETCTSSSPRLALASSPQPADGSIWIAVSVLGAASATTTSRGPGTVVAHTDAGFSSISRGGPQPWELASGPVKLKICAPAALDAMSRGRLKSRVVTEDAATATLAASPV